MADNPLTPNSTNWTPQSSETTNWTPATIGNTNWNSKDTFESSGFMLLSNGSFRLLSDGSKAKLS